MYLQDLPLRRMTKVGGDHGPSHVLGSMHMMESWNAFFLPWMGVFA